MLSLIDIVTVILLLIVVVQDFKRRQISWWLIPGLLIAFAVNGLKSLEIEQLFNYFLINSAFVGIQLLILTAYMSITRQKLVNIIDSYLGLGDVLFFVVICMAFSPLNFIVFYSASLLLSLIVYLIVKSFVREANKYIPLAGIIAGILIVIVFINQFLMQGDFYDDSYITSLLLN